MASPIIAVGQPISKCKNNIRIHRGSCKTFFHQFEQAAVESLTQLFWFNPIIYQQFYGNMNASLLCLWSLTV
jgi:hypothetical protein